MGAWPARHKVKTSARLIGKDEAVVAIFRHQRPLPRNRWRDALLHLARLRLFCSHANDMPRPVPDPTVPAKGCSASFGWQAREYGVGHAAPQTRQHYRKVTRAPKKHVGVAHQSVQTPK
jgi:hypothetical protein